MSKQAIRQKLKNRADELGLEFQQAIQYYAIERFLFRLSTTRWAEQLIVKGATMLRVWEGAIARPTRDIDFLGRVENTSDVIRSIITDCLGADVENDGLEFEQSEYHEQIALDGRYPGVRVKLRGNLDGARFVIQIDVGVDDEAKPDPRWVEYPTFLPGPKPKILAYWPVTSIAEKFEIMVNLGLVNSRMKDYYDIWMLSTTQQLSGSELLEAVTATFDKRETPIPRQPPIALTDDFASKGSANKMWITFRQRLTHSGVDCPEALEEVISLINDLFEPIYHRRNLDGRELTWIPDEGWTKGTEMTSINESRPRL